jgi:hypothetical protein
MEDKNKWKAYASVNPVFEEDQQIFMTKFQEMVYNVNIAMATDDVVIVDENGNHMM